MQLNRQNVASRLQRIQIADNKNIVFYFTDAGGRTIRIFRGIPAVRNIRGIDQLAVKLHHHGVGITKLTGQAPDIPQISDFKFRAEIINRNRPLIR